MNSVFYLMIVGSVYPIILAVGIFMLYRRTGHNMVTCIVVALISIGPNYFHMLTAYWVTLGVDLSLILIVSGVVTFFLPCVILYLAFKRWPKFEKLEKLKGGF